MRLSLAVLAPPPPAWLTAVGRVRLAIGRLGVSYHVSDYEQNGSMVTFAMVPRSWGSWIRAWLLLRRRREYFTNVRWIEIEFRGQRALRLRNALYMPWGRG
jgi:hypothetical protein